MKDVISTKNEPKDEEKICECEHPKGSHYRKNGEYKCWYGVGEPIKSVTGNIFFKACGCKHFKEKSKDAKDNKTETGVGN